MRAVENLEREFDFSSIPEAVLSALSGGPESVAVRLAAALGNRDEDHLTSLVFFWRHAERGGRKLMAGEPGFDALAKEWLEIRETVVRPVLARSSARSGLPGTKGGSVIARVWAFAMGVPAKTSSQAKLVRKVGGLQLTDIALMINSLSDTEFVISPARKIAIRESAAALRSINVDTHLVIWLRPAERYLAEAAAQLRGLCVDSGARSLMFDVEEPWTRNPAIHGKHAEAKAQAIVDRFWGFTSWPCPLGASGITYIPAAVKPVAARCDYVLPQAYSVDKPSNVYRPGVTQAEAHRLWSPLGKPVVMGLAAYKLNHHGGLTDAGAMQKAIAAAEDLRVNEAAYWSLEWIHVPGAKADFLRQASTKARKGISQKASL